MKENRGSNLFTASGCLALGTIGLYQEGKLNSRERALVERHLEDCPLCREAVEGFGLVGSPGRHGEAVTEIRKRFFRSVYSRKNDLRVAATQMASEPFLPRRERSLYRRTDTRNWKVQNWPYYVAVVASLLILVGYFSLFRDSKPDTMMADNFREEEQQAVAAPESVVTETGIQASPVARVPQTGTETRSREVPEKDPVPVPDEEFQPGRLLAELAPDTVEDLAHAADEKVAGVVAADESQAAASEPEMEEERMKMAVAPAQETTKRTAKPTAAGEPIFTIAETMPEFRHKDYKDFAEYIRKNLVYPVDAMEDGIQGTVMVSFVVSSNGRVEKVELARPVSAVLDNEAIRVVKNSPDWMPGKQAGKNVDVQMTIPVSFRLSEK